MARGLLGSSMGKASGATTLKGKVHMPRPIMAERLAAVLRSIAEDRATLAAVGLLMLCVATTTGMSMCPAHTATTSMLSRPYGLRKQ